MTLFDRFADATDVVCDVRRACGVVRLRDGLKVRTEWTDRVRSCGFVHHRTCGCRTFRT